MNPLTVMVIEVGIDISDQVSKGIEALRNEANGAAEDEGSNPVRPEEAVVKRMKMTSRPRPVGAA